MVVFFETLYKSLEKHKPELSGYSLVLGKNIQEEETERLCRELSSSEAAQYTGIWCAGDFLKTMEPYGLFNKPVKGYSELKSFNSASVGNLDAQFPYRERICQALAQGGDRNTLLLGPEFTGKRDGVYHYCSGFLGDIPPLVIRFGSGGRGPACFADALSPAVRTLISSTVKNESSESQTLETLDYLQNVLFKERLREELSAYIVESGRRFLFLLLSAYLEAVPTVVGTGGPFRAALIVEDPLDAEERTGEIFRLAVNSARDRFLVFGICSTDESSSSESLRKWGSVFPRVLRIAAEDSSVKTTIEMPGDLWEAAYAAALLGRYYPAWLFPQLFEDEGLNRSVINKTREIFVLSGAADNAGDLKPRIPGFITKAEKNLGGRITQIRSLVRNCLLTWVKAGKLSPCFGLLKVLAELGGRAEDTLVLRSLRGDVFSCTFAGIDASLKGKTFASCVGAENAPALVWIYHTLKALVYGKPGEIRGAFSTPSPAGGGFYAGCEAQIKANLTSRYLGVRDADAAAETVKETMLLNQSLRDGAIPAYRLFSLVNLFRRRLDDAIEYISFAVEQAEKTGENDELVKACCFAAGIHFLHGSLYRAEQLALKAEKIAGEIGRFSWAGKARFLRGRLNFETGKYGKALEIFEALLTDTAPADVDRIRTLEAWIFRSGVFINLSTGLPAGPPARLENPAAFGRTDGRLFAIEAAFLEGRYQEALDSAGEFLAAAPIEDEDFFFTEQPDWRSGFAQVEDMIVPGGAYRDRLVLVYRALAQSRLDSPREISAGFVGEIQRFARESIPADGDPSDAFYYYALCCMLKNTGAPQVDMGTAVSMAFKRLQRRASRIGDSEIRQAYLSQNYWNSALSLAAKEYKLI
jgi:tetratricopeptide (TPR) repeat protein